MTNINLQLIVFGIDTNKTSQYVLSTTKDKISIPSLQWTKNITMLDNYVSEYISKNYIATSVLELLPQLIKVDYNIENDILNIVYGFIIKYTESINNEEVFWLPYEPLVPNEYSLLLMEVVQKLQ